MAKNLTIEARYKIPEAQICLWICMLLLPVWAAGCPIIVLGICWDCLRNILYMNASSPSLLTLLGSSSQALVFIATTLVGATLSAIFADNRLVASESGLRLPLFVAAKNGFKNHIPWKSITGMQIIGDPDKGIEHLEWRIVTDGYGANSLWLGGLSPQDLEKLLQSAEVWLPLHVKGPLLESVREKLAKLPLLGRERSQKQLYEDELDSRFTATAFVPLEAGDSLQKDSIHVVRQLSFGGLSAVYLVQENKHELSVLKESVVPPDTPPQIKEKAWQLFRREAELLSKLNHPQIVKVKNSFAENNREYLLLEYLPGLNLRQLVREHGVMTEEDTLGIAMSLAQTLGYLHSFTPSVVHRDVTPENIILKSRKGTEMPILIDFGVANEFLGTATGTLVGKHCYISPEQFRGKATAASDLYSLGGTLHFILTGEDPIPLTQSAPAEVNDKISQPVNQLIKDLTALETSDRIATAGQLIDRLMTIADETKSGADTRSPAIN